MKKTDGWPLQSDVTEKKRSRRLIFGKGLIETETDFGLNCPKMKPHDSENANVELTFRRV